MKRVSRKAQSNSKFFGWLTDGASFGAQAGLVPFDDPTGMAAGLLWGASLDQLLAAEKQRAQRGKCRE